jgi:CelD/BcsL family acetyltransferase involved in cellulose biosynthesis
VAIFTFLRHTPRVTIPPTPTRSPIRLEIRHQLGGLESAWDALVDQQKLSSPFLSSWWINNAAEGTPALLCCFAGSELVGGAAFQIDAVGPRAVAVERVRCVGQGTLAPDHLDLIAQPDYAAEVLALVLRWLKRSGSRVVDLDGLAATGALAQSLRSHEIERMAAPWTKLPADSAEYLAARAGQVRSTISRTRKRFVREGVYLRRALTEDMPAALDRLAELHDSRWSEESSFLEGWKRFRAAAIAGAASDSVIIHELVSAEGDVIATELDLLSGNSLAFYQAGRRTEREWRGSGSVLRADILQWACSQGFAEYDLLRGDESYKADWSDTQRQVVRCRMGVGPRGVSLIQAARAQKGLRAGATRCEAIAKKLLSRGPLKSRHEAHSEQSD